MLSFEPKAGFLTCRLARRMQNEHSLSKSKCTDQGGPASPDRAASDPGAAARRQHGRKTVRKPALRLCRVKRGVRWISWDMGQVKAWKHWRGLSLFFLWEESCR